MFVYVIVNHTNGKFYIGKTVSKDLQAYFRKNLKEAESGRTNKPYLYAAFRKYGRNAFRCYPLFVGLNSDGQLKTFECLAIALFGSNDSSVGYNLTAGGEGVTQTPEVRRKIGVKNKVTATGKKKSPDTIARLKASLRAMWDRPGFREAHHNAMLGHVMSPEARAKSSAKQKAV